MWGVDIERDAKAWELTTALCKFNKKPKLTKKLISMAFDEASKFFDMTKFPSTDDGNFGRLRRVQDVSQSIQRRVVAAEPQIRTELERLMGETPTTAGDVRKMEIDMRLLVHLYKLATRSQTGSQEDYWCNKLCRHMIHAE